MTSMMTSLLRDLRFVARTSAKRPGFTAVVLVALALGFGVNLVVFGAINTLFLRPLPVSHADELASVALGTPQESRFRHQLSYADYLSVRDNVDSFVSVAGARFEQFAMTSSEARTATSGEQAEMINTEMVTGNYFDTLGAPALLGRTISEEEGQIPGYHPVAVLSHDFWKRRFARDPSVIGRKVFLNGGVVTIIGVMPERFRGIIAIFTGVDAWIPLALQTRFAENNSATWIADRARREVAVVGRLRPGVTLQEASARVAVLAQTLAGAYPNTNAATVGAVTSEIVGRFGSSYQPLRLGSIIALLVAGLVLVISCANVTNLLLGRATARTKEIGIRLALGARRGRLVRLLLTESVVLALAGGLLGIVLALWFGDLMQAFLPPEQFQYHLEFEPDLKTFAFTLVMCVVAGLGFGFFPALRALGTDVVGALKSDVGSQGQGMRRAGLRQALVIAQIATSIVVVVSGGLVMRSARKLEAVDPGYRTANLVSAIIDPGMFMGQQDDSDMRRFFEDLQRRLERVPGVQAATSARYMPLVNMNGPVGPVIKDGDAPPPPNQGLMTDFNIIAPKYFETMGSELAVGRDFGDAERQGLPTVVIINEELARRLYGGAAAALGQHFRIGGPTSHPLEIVGVVRDGKYLTLFETPRSFLLLPGDLPELDDARSTFRSVILRAASAQDRPAVIEGLRRAVTELDSRVPLQNLAVADEHLAPALYQARLAAELGLVLGCLALGLATLGIYSVMTYSVSQRTKEIGIRMALGGRVGDVIGLVMGQGLRLILIGVVVGALGALVLTRSLSGFLFGVSAGDPATFLATVVILGSVALVATLIPARRATKVDPLVALRYE